MVRRLNYLTADPLGIHVQTQQSALYDYPMQSQTC